MDKQEELEQNWMQGHRAAYRGFLSMCLGELGYEDSSGTHYLRLIKEREDAVFALRALCGEHGDNNWTDSLRLSDIIEKHLGNHLDDGPQQS